MGPYSTPSLKPSPTLACFAKFVSSLTTASNLLSCTKQRFTAMQIWPELPMAWLKTPFAAALGSASSRMIAASLPPSSRVRRFSVPLADAWMALPVRVEPVKEILAMPGCCVIHWPRSSPPLTTLNTPGGKVSARISPKSRVLSGVYGEGFSTMVLPVMRASAIFQAPMSGGKFHGVMPPTTPTGMRRCTTRSFALSTMIFSKSYVMLPKCIM
mmetsp:Transcript_20447/g.64388  ORF Transcript_20447/g.64388 Transcript_20447/m.64388 type:complete len:213 (-) Transcript_20447:387-1025(-)